MACLIGKWKLCPELTQGYEEFMDALGMEVPPEEREKGKNMSFNLEISKIDENTWNQHMHVDGLPGGMDYPFQSGKEFTFTGLDGNTKYKSCIIVQDDKFTEKIAMEKKDGTWVEWDNVRTIDGDFLKSDLEQVSLDHDSILQDLEPVFEDQDIVFQGTEPVSLDSDSVSQDLKLVSEDHDVVFQNLEPVSLDHDSVSQDHEPVFRDNDKISYRCETQLCDLPDETLNFIMTFVLSSAFASSGREFLDSRQCLRSVSRRFMRIVDSIKSKWPKIYCPTSIFGSLISVRKLVLLFGKASGLTIEVKKIVNHKKWINAWLEIQYMGFGWYKIVHVFWKKQ